MFSERLVQDAALIQAQFDLVLGALDDVDVTRAMAYATQGGKRLRGFLVLESARLHGMDETCAIWPATRSPSNRADNRVTNRGALM